MSLMHISPGARTSPVHPRSFGEAQDGEEKKLTAERIARLEVSASGELTVYDTKTAGFAVKVRPSGVKTYMAFYKTPGGRRGLFRR